MEIADAFAVLGVTETTLSPAQRAALDEEGYLLAEGVLDPGTCARLRNALDALAAAEGAAAGHDFHREDGVIRLGNLMNKDPVFDLLFTHPLAVAAVRHVCGEDVGVSSVTGRIALPGQGLQGFHQDFGMQLRPGVWEPGPRRAANAIWLLDAFTAENGATRVIPGTHRIRGTGVGILPDPQATHPRERLVIAPAGSLLVIDAYLWHAGTRNRTAAPRRMANAMCQPRGCYQEWFDRHVTPAAAARLSPAALAFLDHPVRPPRAPAPAPEAVAAAG